MEFDQPKSIYLQIVEQIQEQILDNEWKEDEKIPSIKEMASSIGVNPNTIIRSYQHLLDLHIIRNRRGIGYFVCRNATTRIIEGMRKKFFHVDLPHFVHVMHKLGINFDELKRTLNHWQDRN